MCIRCFSVRSFLFFLDMPSYEILSHYKAVCNSILLFIHLIQEISIITYYNYMYVTTDILNELS